MREDHIGILHGLGPGVVMAFDLEAGETWQLDKVVVVVVVVGVSKADAA